MSLANCSLIVPAIIKLLVPENFPSCNSNFNSFPPVYVYRHRAGVFVHHLVAGSPADECGCINVGDRILEANGYDIRHSTLDQAAAVMGVSI